MADRTSASLFGMIFTYLASDKKIDQAKKLAWDIYAWTYEYDFNTYQMYCDEALLVLGLAKQGEDEEGEPQILYLGEDYGNWPEIKRKVTSND